MDLYVYLSEKNSFNFEDPSSLVWLKEDLIYGDWTSGPNNDGIYSHSFSFPAPEVSYLVYFCLFVSYFIFKIASILNQSEQIKYL